MKRVPLIHAGVIALFLAANAPMEGDEIFASLEPVSEAELNAQRGGFTYAGMDITLGAEIRTFLDGELVLRTTVNWGAQGTSTTEVLSAALSPATAAELQSGILSTGGIRMKVGDNMVFLANEGQTALLHKTDGGLQNILINTANGADMAQEVDATLDVGNYEGFHASVLNSRLSDTIGASIADATAGVINN